MKRELLEILDKAGAKLAAAELLLREGASDDAASRAYYAAFHAITALHLLRGNTFASHGQVIGRFNKDFVKTGVFPPRFTKILARLFEDRQSADYDIRGAVTQEEARQDVNDSREIVRAIEHYLQSQQHL